MPELRIKEVRLPELHLPEMSRDDIDRVISDARDEIGRVELPDLTKVELPRIDLSRIDLPKAVAGASFLGRKPARSRWPFVVGGVIAVGAMTALVLNQEPVRARLRELAMSFRQRMDERRAEMETRRQGAHAFDASVAVPIQPSAFADDAPSTGSPFDGSDGLPEGFGGEVASMPPETPYTPVEDATRV